MNTADPLLVPLWTPPQPVARNVELFLFDLDHSLAHDEPKPHIRRRAVGRRVLLHLLASRLGVAPEDIEIGRAAGGKPMLHCPQSPLAFSVSYTRRWFAAALTQGTYTWSETGSEFTLERVLPVPSGEDTLKRELQTQIGVDVETLDPTIEAMETAHHHFHPNELAHLQSLAPADRPLAFYRLWTAKEAVLKALGTGLSLDSRQVEIEPGPVPRLRMAGYSMHLNLWQLPIAGDTLILALARPTHPGQPISTFAEP
ncbi:MAG: 4'-phosphopantetheinyl transferase superfamily protein [Tepidisphaeraceae bacterium]|jgi:phosphopantetheinyl transferase